MKYNFGLNSPHFVSSPKPTSNFWNQINVNIDFAIAGAPKCGTSWLADNISKHPDIYLPTEQNLFTIHRNKGVETFNALYINKNHKLLGDYSGTHIIDENMPKNYATHFPGIKLIFILREQAERAFSQYLMDGYRKHINMKKDSLLDVLINPVTYSYYNFGLYYQHLKRYLDYIDQKNILVLTFDELKTQPINTLNKVFNFLGVNTFENLQVSKAKNSWFDSKLKNHSFYSKYFYYKEYILSEGGSLPKKLLANTMNNYFKGMKHFHRKPTLTKKTADIIKTQYREENEKLEKEFFLNIKSWY